MLSQSAEVAGGNPVSAFIMSGSAAVCGADLGSTFLHLRLWLSVESRWNVCRVHSKSR